MSKKLILSAEQYATAEKGLVKLASSMKDPTSTAEERNHDYWTFKRTSELMADYQIAIDCRDEQTRQRYIEQGVTTQAWLDEYWSEIDGTDKKPTETKQQPSPSPPPVTDEPKKPSMWDLMDDDE